MGLEGLGSIGVRFLGCSGAGFERAVSLEGLKGLGAQ